MVRMRSISSIETEAGNRGKEGHGCVSQKR